MRRRVLSPSIVSSKSLEDVAALLTASAKKGSGSATDKFELVVGLGAPGGAKGSTRNNSSDPYGNIRNLQ